ncbi:hypothetical protein Tco_1015419 [Tanacetum coccineum]|uniref:Uncharacterized protein n=1 Tax=Tanacetum coccineum TaxID=301880 RepID=A0ABQ5FLF0_9ASTR
MPYPENSIHRIEDYLKILKDIKRGPYSKKPPIRRIDLNQYGVSIKLFKTPSLEESSSLEFDLFSDLEEHSEEEIIEAMRETMEEYMCKTRGDYGFSGSDHEDANKHIEKVLEIVDLFHILEITQDQIMLRAFLMSLTGVEVILFYKGFEVPTRQILDFKGAIPTMTAANARVTIQEMAEHSQKWHNEMSTRTRSTETSDGLAAI